MRNAEKIPIKKKKHTTEHDMPYFTADNTTLILFFYL